MAETPPPVYTPEQEAARYKVYTRIMEDCISELPVYGFTKEELEQKKEELESYVYKFPKAYYNDPKDEGLV